MATPPASALGEQERDVLRALAKGEPLRRISPPVRGRLALYNLIAETPRGWIITEAGREALIKAPPETASEAPVAAEDIPLEPAAGPNRGRRGRKTRRSPFNI